MTQTRKMPSSHFHTTMLPLRYPANIGHDRLRIRPVNELYGDDGAAFQVWVAAHLLFGSPQNR